MTLNTPSAVAARTQSGPYRSNSGKEHVWLAVLLVFAVAFRMPLPLGIQVGFLVGAFLLPVTVAVLPRARGLPAFALLCVLAAVSGAVLTLVFATDGPSDTRNLVIGSIRMLSVPVAVISLLWARVVIGTAAVVRIFALGSLLSLVLVGVNVDNLWKFSLAVPVTLLLLSLPWVYGRRLPELLLILVLTVASATNDARSAAAMLLIAAVLLIAQRHAGSAPRRVGVVLVLIGVAVMAGYFAAQALIQEGALGEAARERTEMQIQQSGSVLLGGRPEIGATLALLGANPLGFGSGTLVTYENLQLAKTGMARINYEPNNRYVEAYMFGSGYEVHSVIGDLWLWFGPLGLVVSLFIAWVLIRGMAVAIGNGVATGVLLYLALRSLWDLPFSPFLSALLTLALALAVCWPLSVEDSPVTSRPMSPGSRQVGNQIAHGSLRSARVGETT